MQALLQPGIKALSRQMEPRAPKPLTESPAKQAHSVLHVLFLPAPKRNDIKRVFVGTKHSQIRCLRFYQDRGPQVKKNRACRAICRRSTRRAARFPVESSASGGYPWFGFAGARSGSHVVAGRRAGSK